MALNIQTVPITFKPFMQETGIAFTAVNTPGSHTGAIGYNLGRYNDYPE
jgi:hypothetical protein